MMFLDLINNDKYISDDFKRVMYADIEKCGGCGENVQVIEGMCEECWKYEEGVE